MVPNTMLVPIKTNPMIAFVEKENSNDVPSGLIDEIISRQKTTPGIRDTAKIISKILVHFFISLFFARFS